MIRVAAYLFVAAFLGIGVPWLGMRMLAGALRESPTVTNYRGRPVFLGLGIVWVFWAAAALIGGWVVASGEAGLDAAAVLPVAGLLALVAFTLGMIDDAFGTSAARGFRGHVGALLHGRLTTGGMKLFGISLASYVVALVVLAARSDSALMASGVALWALPAGAAIALTSNLLNLTDLRPGRALKSYSLLALLGVISSAVGLRTLDSYRPFGPFASVSATIVLLALFAFGPVLAVWRYDLGEEGMLGDAGANPAGAVAGLLIVAGLPNPAILVYFAIVFALNLASERVSFSKVIEGSAFLTRLDAIGRRPPE